MLEIEVLKEDIINNLEKNFIDNFKAIVKEVELFNILITSFVDDEYTYDEYCKCRMKFELEGCELVDIDINEEQALSSQDRNIIHNRAVKKHMENHEETIYEELLKEEFVKWQVEKISLIDQKVFYTIFRHASIKMLKNKIKGYAWESNEEYFVEICEHKAKNLAAAVAENNKEAHEEQIRSSNI